jgi:hypothetical protein
VSLLLKGNSECGKHGGKNYEWIRR